MYVPDRNGIFLHFAGGWLSFQFIDETISLRIVWVQEHEAPAQIGQAGVH